MKERMELKPGTKKVAVHIAVWTALFIINGIIIQRYSMRVNWLESIKVWSLYIFIFYVNYLLLIPRLLFRRKYFGYVLSALFMLVLCFFTVRISAVWNLRKNLEQLAEQIEAYEDVREAIEQREREWNRRRDRDREAREPGELPDSIRRGDGLIGGREDRQIQFEPLTDREEEYLQLRRELDRNRMYTRWFTHGGYSPVARPNAPYAYSLILFYMASIVAAYMDKSGKAERRRQQMEREKIAAELAYLKQQVNPHFLFNTLNSIYSQTIGVSDTASDSIIKLSSILRYMLYETNREKVLLTDEVNVIFDYIALQKLRLTDKTEVTVDIQGDVSDHKIEPMILIPIIENAFKYGVDSFEPSFVTIGIEVSGNEFTCVVRNRVVHRGDGDTSRSGIGIKNIRRRLELIYGRNYFMKAGEEYGIYTVILRLKLTD